MRRKGNSASKGKGRGLRKRKQYTGGMDEFFSRTGTPICLLRLRLFGRVDRQERHYGTESEIWKRLKNAEMQVNLRQKNNGKRNKGTEKPASASFPPERRGKTDAGNALSCKEQTFKQLLNIGSVNGTGPLGPVKKNPVYSAVGGFCRDTGSFVCCRHKKLRTFRDHGFFLK